MTRKHAEWLVLLIFACVIGVVFQQISTSMTEQGIASGSPYDNAAAYPKAVAILMSGLLVLAAVSVWRLRVPGPRVLMAQLARPVALLAVFACYLLALGTLGYHLSTPPMLMALLWVCGYRRPVPMLIYGIGISFGLAFLFEVFLKIVLPGGIWHLNIPW
jgi:hypothetical protein